LSLGSARDTLEAAYRAEARRVLATLIRLLGGFDAAEEAMHDAFAAAAEQWPRDGIPANPYAWLVSAGRFKAIDRWRRRARLAGALPDLAALSQAAADPALPEVIADDELRLIFTCCHPALPRDGRIALTLREVGGLTTEEIARAYLVSTPTVAQRIVRAKARIKDAAIPYEVPARRELPDRLDSVLQVVYLIFNEGYSSTVGPSLTRGDLCTEAIRLTRLIAELLDEPEALGLLGLMLLHDARRLTRTDEAGDLILLEDQDRSRWDRARVAEARSVIAAATVGHRTGPYLVQAAIAAVHAEAESFAATDWSKITALYEALRQMDPSPVIALNHAVALAMRNGPEVGLPLIEALLEQGDLHDYHLAHAARADLQRRLGRVDAARASYRTALAFARQPAERRFLERRLIQLAGLNPREVRQV
jgi:RNA polymerase sigma-70 factor (ECF subfamily)